MVKLNNQNQKKTFFRSIILGLLEKFWLCTEAIKISETRFVRVIVQ